MKSLILSQCWVCSESSGLNNHHVIPQAYGGVNGPQVTLCAVCHSKVHATALKPAGVWHHMLQGDAKLMELTRLIAEARARCRGVARPMMVQHKFSTSRGEQLRELKHLLGCGSITDTLDKCVDILYAQYTNTPCK